LVLWELRKKPLAAGGNPRQLWRSETRAETV
jgi:hypothetical protein